LAKIAELPRKSESQIIMIIKDLYALAIKEAESSIQNRLKDEFANLKRYAKEISAPDEVCLSMSRSIEGRPIIHCSVFLRDEYSPSFEHSLSLDKFLDETERNYEGSGIEGWGDAMIDDLEKLKVKIQKRITRMEKAIAKESE